MTQHRATVIAALAALLIVNPALGNRVDNPDFDDLDPNGVPESWYPFGAAGFYDWGGYGDLGWCATLWADDPANEYGGFFQPYIGNSVDDVGGTSYTLSMYIWPEGNWDATTFIGFEWMASDDSTEIGETFEQIVITQDMLDKWTLVTVTAVAPPGTYYVRPNIHFDDPGNVMGWGEWFWFDVVTMEVTDNRVHNPGFEINWGEGWDWPYDEADWSLDAWWGHPDEHIYFWGNGHPNPYVGTVFQTGICGIEGVEYELTIEMGFEDFWWGTVEYGLQFMEADDATMIDEVLTTMTPGTNMGYPPLWYQRYQMTAVAPPGTYFVRPIIRHTGFPDGPEPCAAVLDNIVLLSISGDTDLDDDGVDDCEDACRGTPAGIPVDSEGRPVGDADEDCDVDMDDFALFQQSFMGPM
jgi:hypothetical protein